MNIVELLFQDGKNIVEFLKFAAQNRPITLLILIILFIGFFLTIRFENKRNSNPYMIIQEMKMDLNYTYEGNDYSYLLVRKRNDGKFNISNHQKEMVSGIEDAMELGEFFAKLAKKN